MKKVILTLLLYFFRAVVQASVPDGDDRCAIVLTERLGPIKLTYGRTFELCAPINEESKEISEISCVGPFCSQNQGLIESDCEVVGFNFYEYVWHCNNTVEDGFELYSYKVLCEHPGGNVHQVYKGTCRVEFILTVSHLANHDEWKIAFIELFSIILFICYMGGGLVLCGCISVGTHKAHEFRTPTQEMMQQFLARRSSMSALYNVMSSDQRRRKSTIDGGSVIDMTSSSVQYNKHTDDVRFVGRVTREDEENR